MFISASWSWREGKVRTKSGVVTLICADRTEMSTREVGTARRRTGLQTTRESKTNVEGSFQGSGTEDADTSFAF